ncbi:MAG: hypothetical protein AB7L13_15720 [Acidimicrobiia bacterium]
MPGARTEITELATALGLLASDLDTALARKPDRLRFVDDVVWQRLVDSYRRGDDAASFATAFANGAALLAAHDGLRFRAPLLVEWRGPHRPPGDDVVPSDLRIDHVYQVSCKYLSKITQNAGPARLFDRLLVGEERGGGDWFAIVAPDEYQQFYESVVASIGCDLPAKVGDLTTADRALLKEVLRPRALPEEAAPAWVALCRAVAQRSADAWRGRLVDKRTRLRLLWRLLRISDAPYFILGVDKASFIRLRVASTWDWVQAYELDSFVVEPRESGQPEVNWRAEITERSSGLRHLVAGHVEIRWSHGRFQGSPEAKVYLETSHAAVPGFYALR